MNFGSLKKIIGAVILIVGVVLIIMGSRNKHGTGLEKIKRQITMDHAYTEETSRYLVSGVAFVVVGAVMVVCCWCNKKKR